MLNELLENCGLTTKEQRLFRCLYTEGASAASVLAKRTGFKRPTVYAALDSMTQLGIVSRKTGRDATVFSLVDPKLIPKILQNHAERRLSEAIASAERLPVALAELQRAQKLSFGDFEVTVLENIEAIHAQLAGALE